MLGVEAGCAAVLMGQNLLDRRDGAFYPSRDVKRPPIRPCRGGRQHRPSSTARRALSSCMICSSVSRSAARMIHCQATVHCSLDHAERSVEPTECLCRADLLITRAFPLRCLQGKASWPCSQALRVRAARVPGSAFDFDLDEDDRCARIVHDVVFDATVAGVAPRRPGIGYSRSPSSSTTVRVPPCTGTTAIGIGMPVPPRFRCRLECPACNAHDCVFGLQFCQRLAHG